MRCFRLGCPPLLWAALLLATATAHGQEISFVEEYVLASDRTQALESLIPGSEEYYYYHSLHHLSLQQYDQVRALLKPWIEQHRRTSLVRRIEHRLALATFEQDPRATFDYVIHHLGLRYDHQQKRRGVKPQLPTKFDLALLDYDRLTQQALQRHRNSTDGFEDRGLPTLAQRQLSDDIRRHLLSRLRRPDVENLAQLVKADLAYRNSGGFGSLKIHTRMLKSQLDELARILPTILLDANYVNTYLKRLQPAPDADWERIPEEEKAYLDRLWSFVSQLSPSFNSLKANVLHRRLQWEKRQGRYDREMFLAYLRLPRQAGYMRREYYQRRDLRGYLCNLGEDFRSVTLIPPVGDDTSLIREFVLHFFEKDTTYRGFAEYLDSNFLKRNFAEAKLVNGLGAGPDWYALLTPEQLKSLQDRVDIDFADTNPTVFDVDAPVQLEVYLKNTPSLIVKVFEVNTGNYYRENGREVSTDIPLDGLVANLEKTHTYDEPPIRRVKRRFEFPNLNRRGVFVVDFIGNGHSSRVVIRKGRLWSRSRNIAEGQLLRVFNERNQPVKDAVVWMGGTNYVSDADGEVLLPYSTRPSRRPIVLSQGDFASIDYLQHQGEAYSLTAGFYVDRESLIPHEIAQLLVRPGLEINGRRVSVEHLKDVRLQVTSHDADGVEATQTVGGFELSDLKESVHAFRTPQRLASLTFTLTAKVKSLTQNKDVDLQASESITLNGIDKSAHTRDIHFTRFADDYFLELLGKAGEPLADQPVQVVVKHRDFKSAVAQSLKTDAAGRVELGPLADIVSVRVVAAGCQAKSFTPSSDAATMVARRTAAEGDVLQFAYMGTEKAPTRSEFALWELRANEPAYDRFGALAIEDGMLIASDLKAGDYVLLDKTRRQQTRLVVTSGAREGAYVLGRNRVLEGHGGLPLQIANASVVGEDLVVRLKNAGSATRVHVAATRYQPAYSIYGQLAKVGGDVPGVGFHPEQVAFYAENRMLGEEVSYILDRRLARTFPGNMLTRPSLLLNPWAVRSTETDKQEAASGEDFAHTPPPAAAEAPASESAALRQQAMSGWANLDFLAREAVVQLNHAPDASGVVRIPLKELEGKHWLHIAATNPTDTVVRNVALKSPELRIRDLRLTRGLDPESHFTQQKKITSLAEGEKLVVQDAASARVEAYDSLRRLFSLYKALSNEGKLDKFAFLLDWPKKTPEQKRELYSKHACHELHYFLFRRDPEFFQSVIRPYLEQKHDKTFLDDYLLERDLTAYAEPWRFARLNTVERVLLGHRLAEARPWILRDIQDRVDLIANRDQALWTQFDWGLRGNALKADDKLAVLQESLELMDEMRASNLAQFESDGAEAAPMGSAMLGGMGGGGGRRGGAERTQTRRSLGEALKSKARGFRAPQTAADSGVESRNRFGFGAGRELALGRKRAKGLYQTLDRTKEYAENNYHELPIEAQLANLVGPRGFWADFASTPAAELLRTDNLTEPTENFTEIMFALSVLDLPFESGEQDVEVADGVLTLTASQPTFVFHQEIQPADVSKQAPVLVSQNFFNSTDRYEQVDGQRREKYVAEEFLAGQVYGGHVVVTNPTASQRRLDLLVQIPVGAMPVQNGQATKTVRLELGPYHTQTFEYFFYFPAPGKYAQFPAHVGEKEQVVAHAGAFEFNVVRETQPHRRERLAVCQPIRRRRHGLELPADQEPARCQSRRHRLPYEGS